MLSTRQAVVTVAVASSWARGVLAGKDYDRLLEIIATHADASHGSGDAFAVWQEHCSIHEKWRGDDYKVLAGIAGASLVATVGLPAIAASASAHLVLGGINLAPEALVIAGFVSLASLTIVLGAITLATRRAARRWRLKAQAGAAWIQVFLPS
jgi:hypothetical protein